MSVIDEKEDVSAITAEAFDIHAHTYEEQTRNFRRDHLAAETSYFLDNLPGRRILDIGSGPGRDSEYFLEERYQPFCIDLSPTMVSLCRKKDLEAEVLDFKELGKRFPEGSFDGAWAYTSLNLMPKRDLPEVLAQIRRILVPKGLLFIGVHEGDSDSMFERPRWGRYWKARYHDAEMSDLLSRQFEILSKTQTRVPSRFSDETNTYLNYVCRRRSELS